MDGLRLYALLERIGNLLRADLRRAATEQGVALIQLEMTHYLAMCNRYSDTPGAAAEYFGATKGTTSQTLAALEAKGLLRKVVDAKDGRSVHCRLTARGRALVRKTLPPALLADLVAHEAMPDGLDSHLTELLRQLQRNNDSRSFGVCRTCVNFQRRSEGYWCGLTEEPLSEDDSLRICREHETSAA